MEISGIKFALLLLSPLVLIVLLRLLLSPLINRQFDKEQSVRQEIKSENKKFWQQFKDRIYWLSARMSTGVPLTKEESRQAKEEALESQIKFREASSARLKKLRKLRREDSGLDDLNKELNKDIKDFFK